MLGFRCPGGDRVLSGDRLDSFPMICPTLAELVSSDKVDVLDLDSSATPSLCGRMSSLFLRFVCHAGLLPASAENLTRG